jgi:hypothetical protein
MVEQVIEAGQVIDAEFVDQSVPSSVRIALEYDTDDLGATDPELLRAVTEEAVRKILGIIPNAKSPTLVLTTTSRDELGDGSEIALTQRIPL